MGSKRMNILILSWRGPGHPFAGGAEISTHEHAKGWVKAGNKVTLFTSHFLGAKREEFIDGVLIKRFGYQFLGVHAGAFFWYFFGRHDWFDVVVDQFHGIPFFTPLYVKAKKLAFIHEVAKEVWFLYPWPKPFNHIFGWIGNTIEPLFFKLYKKIPFMSVSESTKKDLLDLGIPDKSITIVHNGVSTVTVNFKKEKTKTLIYLGALTKDKGIEDAIEVFNQINKKGLGWQFWIVGGGNNNYVDYLKEKTLKLGIDKKTKFWGYVDQRKKFELLHKSHFLINTSIREGWGLVNIEANSAGIPVLGYNVPGMVDSVKVGKTGYLFDKGNIKEISEKVSIILRDNDVYDRLSKNSILWSKKFTWTKATNMSLKLINNL